MGTQSCRLQCTSYLSNLHITTFSRNFFQTYLLNNFNRRKVARRRERIISKQDVDIFVKAAWATSYLITSVVYKKRWSYVRRSFRTEYLERRSRKWRVDSCSQGRPPWIVNQLSSFGQIRITTVQGTIYILRISTLQNSNSFDDQICISQIMGFS